MYSTSQGSPRQQCRPECITLTPSDSQQARQTGRRTAWVACLRAMIMAVLRREGELGHS